MADKTQLSLTYDSAQRRGVITFANGHALTLDNVTAEQARDFTERHGAEFAKRDCFFHSSGGEFTRSNADE